MEHPSFGSYTADQVKEASNKPFGLSKLFLESCLSGICPYCLKPKKNLPEHFKKSKYCGDKSSNNEPSIADFWEGR